MVAGALCAASALIMAFAAQRYSDEMIQRLNAGIAMYVDREAQLISRGRPDKTRLAELARHAMILNPLATVYLVDPTGRILAGGSGHIDIAPLQRLLEAHPAGPIYGTDPAHPDRKRVFSAAPVHDGDSVVGFVYVVLGGDPARTLASTIASSLVLQLAPALLVLVALAASLVSVFIDRWARQARQQVMALRDADQNRRLLFESIGHDLRTPLAAATGYVELLERDAGRLSQSQQTQYLGIVRQHCERLTRLIAQIFRLARLDSPHLHLRLEPVCIPELVYDIGERFRHQADGGNRVQLEIEREVPQVVADCELLETIVENLLDNALQHAGNQTPVQLSVRIQDRTIVVCIHDHGPGVDVANLHHHAAAPAGKRRGLGLVIVTRALRLLGSELEMVSQPGQGTRMSFRLGVMIS